MDAEGKVFRVEGLVCSRGDGVTDHYIHTNDGRLVFAAGLLQFSIGTWVTVVITETEPRAPGSFRVEEPGG